MVFDGARICQSPGNNATWTFANLTILAATYHAIATDAAVSARLAAGAVGTTGVTRNNAVGTTVHVTYVRTGRLTGYDSSVENLSVGVGQRKAEKDNEG
jgi:hypothetical protein